jgi:alkylation response protein AidB-like acyl-CoA dehydrogenase
MGQPVDGSATSSSEEKQLLRDSAVVFCQRDASVARMKTLKQSDQEFDRGLWQTMAELGWCAILVDEDIDGLGLGLDAAAVVAEELGRVVAPEPFIEVAGIAVTLLNQLAASQQRDSLLRATTTGDLVPIVCCAELHAEDLDSLPVAVPNGSGYSISGSCVQVPHAQTADGFLLPALFEGELALFWIARSTRGVVLSTRLLADNTSYAQVKLKDALVAQDSRLGQDQDIGQLLRRAIDCGQILTAAYMCGLMTQALDTTLEYLRTRKQFGRTIGSFQALQHGSVDLYIQQELASAVVAHTIDAMACANDDEERAELASRARYRATKSGLEITRAAIQMHGAIGFTDECDIGHFLNRALVLSSRRGNLTWHLRRLVKLLERTHNDTETKRNAGAHIPEPEPGQFNGLGDEEFRLLVRGWYEREYPTEMRYPSRRLHWHEIKDWYLKVSAKGWLAPSWPVEFGGMGLSPAKLLIFIEEQERWGVARAPDMGITMIGPLLIQHGTAEQRAHYLPKILAGENIWCQGYSEPNAGSDLASLQCEAILDGDEFVINGQKTWTTLAQDATNIFLLVRTDKKAKKQAGISFLLVDVKTPGITIRPIRNIAGDEEFCEVFFDDVRVPADSLVGELNTGWGIAKALLSFERIFLGSPKQSQYALLRLDSIIAGRGLADDPGFMERLTRLKIDALDLEVIYARFAQIVRDGGTLGPDVSILKIWATETFARVSELMLEAAEERGAERGELDFGAGEANILSQFYNARPATIYGGSNEIQRNIVAKNVLELPDS